MGIARHNMVIIKWRKNEKTTFVTYFLQKMNKKSSIRVFYSFFEISKIDNDYKELLRIKKLIE